MIVTVQEVFDLALELDLKKIAHRVFWAISQGLVTTTCDSNKLHELNYDEEQIEEMIDKNLLQIGLIQLYVAQTSHNMFAFYYAKENVEAYSLHIELFRQKPKSFKNANRLLSQRFYFLETDKSEVLFTHRGRVVDFPYYLGVAKPGEYILS